MAQYLILIYEDESSWSAADQETYQQVYRDHEAFMAANQSSLRGGNALQNTSTATAVRRDPSGGFTVTDGPFAEAKEALGGYYLVEAADLDEALKVAQQVPAPFGGVEVRPVMAFD